MYLQHLYLACCCALCGSQIYYIANCLGMEHECPTDGHATKLHPLSMIEVFDPFQYYMSTEDQTAKTDFLMNMTHALGWR
jgi:hypothetical protein